MIEPRVVKISREEFKRLLGQVIKIPSAKTYPVCKDKGCGGKLKPISFNCSKVVNHECDKCKKLYCCEETLQNDFEVIVIAGKAKAKRLALVS